MYFFTFPYCHFNYIIILQLIIKCKVERDRNQLMMKDDICK